MSITGSLYTGIAGMQTHGKAMSVIGNNLANSNTVGFKGSRTTFEDTFYRTVSSAGGTSQTGTGSTVSSILGVFRQGAFQNGSAATDMAIGGTGLFKVRNQTTGGFLYTRAGGFRFNKDGLLTDANGYALQGWAVDGRTPTGAPNLKGSPGDIKLDKLQSPPQATKSLSFRLNLNKDADDKSTNSTNPFTSMLSNWNGKGTPPIANTRYAYQTTLKVYDKNGGAHDITVYMDPVKDSAVTAASGGKRVWEYTVTCNPSEDGRTLGGNKVSGTSAAGLLMTGTITFDSGGKMDSMTAFTLPSGASGNLRNPSNWTPAKFSPDGYPTFTANFLGEPNANATNSSKANPIEINFGLRNKDQAGTGWTGMPANAGALGNTFGNLGKFNDTEVKSNAFTNYTSASTTYEQTQDGFGVGSLQSIEVSKEGVVTGRYSNGQVLDLYAVALSSFRNMDGLKRMGGNLYAKTRKSGEESVGLAGTGNLGAIRSNALEQSNVDVGEEMVRLITIQRGFSANGKVITTADQMMQEALNLKR